MPNARLCFFIPLGVAVASLAGLVALGAAGWPGELSTPEGRFCEAARPGPIKQPANTWSNAGFYLIGLWIGWQAWRDVAAAKKPGWSNTLVTTVRYPATFAICSILIGAGSTALHASGTRWGAKLDLWSMHLWGAWCIAFATTRLLRVGDRQFLSLWLAQVGGLAARTALGEPYTIKGSDLFGSMIATAILIEALGRWRNRHRTQVDAQYLVWSVVIFLTAYACFLTSSAAGPWCEPSSFWQGHAAWHLLCAGSTAFVYLYGRSERSVKTSDALST